MAIYNPFDDFSEQLVRGVQNFGTDAFKIALTNSAPIVSNTILANITQIAAGNGYTLGGTAIASIAINENLGTTTVTGTQVVFTASGGSIGPFRYAVLYNDTATSPPKPLVAWWDYGSSITLNDTDTFTVKFNNASPGNILVVAP
jgi:hypothetical protein